jgi:hypothetical protein
MTRGWTPTARSIGIELSAMPYKLASGRRYLNGELVDQPQLGPWSEADWHPTLDWDDLICAGLFELDYSDTKEWEQVEQWLLSLEESDIPLSFLLERCCDVDGLLSTEVIETRLKDFPAHWQSACLTKIEDVPECAGYEIVAVVASAVRMDRARRSAEPRVEEPPRSTLTFFRPG